MKSANYQELRQIQCGGLIYAIDEYTYTAIVEGPANGIGITSCRIENEIDGIPVTCIEMYAFKNDITLNRIWIPDSVLWIGDNAFDGCVALKEVRLPNNLEELGEYAFRDCCSLLGIGMPLSLHRIEPGTFSGSGLVSISIPTNVKSIGHDAFANCKYLENISYEAGIEFDENVFTGCKSLNKVDFHKYNSKR